MPYGDHDGTPFVGQVVTYVLSLAELMKYQVERVFTATITFIHTTTCVDLQATVNVPPSVAKSAPITSFSIASNVVTFIAANNFSNGDSVTISVLSVGTYLNGQTLKVIPSGGTQFTAAFTHADVGSTADSGTAKQVQTTLTPLNVGFGTAQGNWYTGTGTVLPAGSPW